MSHLFIGSMFWEEIEKQSLILRKTEETDVKFEPIIEGKKMNTENLKIVRERSHMGMLECKNALSEANDDIELALEILQKKGLKKVDNIVLPLEGVVFATPEGKVFELNCETDFAARSEVFQKLVATIAEQTKDFNWEISHSAEVIEQATKVLREKIVLRRVSPSVRKYQVMSFFTDLTHYNHPGGKIAVSLATHTKGDITFNFTLAENISMQIAANNPLCVDIEDLPADLIEKKKTKFLEEVEGKPEAAKAKIIEGKLKKWYSEVVLLEQFSLMNPKETIRQQLTAASMEIVDFVRFERGETTNVI